MTEIQFTSRSVSRRTVIKGAAATAAAIPMSQLLGGEVSAAGKTLRVGHTKQNQAASPATTADGGSLQILGCVGEWLAWVAQDGSLEPRVAESWKASNGLKTWTFKIRKGIKFHNGQDLTADDVVWTFKWHTTASNASSQAGNYKGVLSPAGVVKTGTYEVTFNLDAPDSSFPYTVASTSYGSLIMPNGVAGDKTWIAKMISAGPWVLESHVEGNKTVFTRNDNYWDKTRRPAFEKLEMIQFASAAAAVPQLTTGKIDVILALAPEDATKLKKNKKVTLDYTPGARTLHGHMRCDWGPFTDKRVRRAAALTLDRKGYIKGVMKGFGALGNDSPMDPFPTRDTTVPQREQDLAEAKKLMAAAGNKGFTVDLSSWQRDDIVKFAQVIKDSLKAIGITANLKIDGPSAAVYYGNPYPSKKGVIFEYDNNAWLASNLGITDWGGRAVPDLYLRREYKSTGDWSAAHYDSAAFDAAADEYLNAASPAKKKVASGKIQRIALEDTPYIISYYDVGISPRRSNIKGVFVNSMSQIDTSRAAG